MLIYLRIKVALTSLLAVFISIVASMLIARGIARPVCELADVAGRIASGDYSTNPAQTRSDEIGELATAFRTMQNRIAARESRIMDLAYRDTLTALPNRAKFNERLEAELLKAHGNDRMAGVLLKSAYSRSRTGFNPQLTTHNSQLSTLNFQLSATVASSRLCHKPSGR